MLQILSDPRGGVLTVTDPRTRQQRMELWRRGSLSGRYCRSPWQLTWLAGNVRVQVYAVVKEKRLSRPTDTICASRDHRESLVYSSLSNHVEIRIVTNAPSRRRHKADYFAIRYECSFCSPHSHYLSFVQYSLCSV